MNRTIFQGDVLEKLAEIESESIDCVISSPPYWGLRDYGTGKWVGGDPKCDHKSIRRKTRAERGGLSDIQKNNNGSFGDELKWSSKICPDCNAHYEDGQLGLEPDFRDYLKTMNDIMVQLKRVLKNTGTCWINLGDTYSTVSGGMRDMANGKSNNHGQINYDKNKGFQKSLKIDQSKQFTGLKSKSRVGIPERFYINCIDDGWIARNHIPWYKANSMPSSVKDRFTNKWESIFFFAKQQKYYFDLDSVREQLLGKESKPFNVRVRDAKNGYLQQKFGEKYKASKKEIENYDNDHITKKTRKEGKADWEDRKWSSVDGQPTQTIAKNHSGNYDKNTGKVLNTNWVSGFDEDGNCYGCGKPKSKHHSGHDKNINNGDTAEYTPCNARGKNPGDVFFINPRPFPEAHFATFPVDLPTKILKCACPKDGIVLDPFLGSGTVGVAAEQLGLKWCGIELNEEYITLARKRLDPFRNDSLEMFT